MYYFFSNVASLWHKNIDSAKFSVKISRKKQPKVASRIVSMLLRMVRRVVWILVSTMKFVRRISRNGQAIGSVLRRESIWKKGKLLLLLLETNLLVCPIRV